MKFFIAAPRWPTKSGFICTETPSLAKSQWGYKQYKVYEVLSTPNVLPPDTANAAPVQQPTPVTPPNNNPTPAKKPEKKPKAPVTPKVPVAWKPTDPHYEEVRKSCTSGFWREW